jgi:hypothetical protein
LFIHARVRGREGRAGAGEGGEEEEAKESSDSACCVRGVRRCSNEACGS